MRHHTVLVQGFHMFLLIGQNGQLPLLPER